MRYLALIYTEERTDAPPSDGEGRQMMAEYGEYTEMVKDRGALLGGEALEPSSAATTVRVRDGNRTITDGPFEWVDLKGHNRGRYWLVKADEVQATLKPVSKSSGGEAAGPLPVAKQTSATELPVEKPSSARAFSAASIGSDTGVLILSSDTIGAEIYIDGKFVGDTPSTISLPSGTHQIAIKANGKKDWKREIEVMKGSQATLHPVLEPLP